MNPFLRWLLCDNPSLIGDLLEERSAGRSRRWYYRQIIVGIARSMVTGVRRHPVLIVRAVVIAACSYLLLASATAIGAGFLYGYFFSPVEWSRMIPDDSWSAIPMVVIPSVLTGWLVARTNRRAVQAAIATILLLWAVAATPWDWIGAASALGFLAGASIDVRKTLSVLK